jgi:hypothetical protein
MNLFIANDDHFTVANVACGYSVAFVLQCFLVFFALVQAWVYVQIHRTAPNIGDGVGVFLVKDRGQSMQMHVRSPARSSHDKGTQTVYKVTKKGESNHRLQSGQQSSSGRSSGRTSSGGDTRPKSAADRRESLTAARNASASPKKAPPIRSTDKPYDAYAANAGKCGYDNDDDEDHV